MALESPPSQSHMTDYHAKYLAHFLLKKGGSDKMERLAGTMRDAKIELTPHQVEAALFAFRSPLSKGVILADEVGLGKTIEAGLVISQKWAERKRRILIIVPANLRKQWNQELWEKFYLPSVILEAKSYKESETAGNSNPFQQDVIVICSYHFASRQYEKLMTVKWDLAVIDEAHKLRNVHKESNRIANNLKIALRTAPKVLLTATPLQNSLLELYGLVSFIDEYHFGDKKSFTSQYSNRISDAEQFSELRNRLKPVCHRTLRKEVLEYVSYTNRRCVTQDFFPGDEEQRLYNEVSDYLADPNIQALPPSQRSLMILVMRKLLASSTFAIAGALDSLARKLNRRLKDSDEAEKELLEEEGLEEDFDGLEDLIEEWGEDEESPVLQQSARELVEAEVLKLEALRDLAVSITHNAKGEKLLTALDKGLTMARSLGAAEKAIIFTESRRTQDYLLRILQETPFKDEIVLFNGSNTDPLSRDIYNAWKERHKGSDQVTGSRTADMRSALVDYFRDEGKIMIATEAGAEGINLQFCSMIVNFDLPWNPQRIEQRIGRCHRFGQKHDVVVVNFLNQRNEADKRVYDLLAGKLQLFEGVFGASDDVLGAIESGVDFEKRIVHIYQTCRKVEQIEFEFDKLKEECEEQRQETYKATHQKLLDNFDEEVQEKLRFNHLKTKEYVDRVTQNLSRVTRHILRDAASFNTDFTEFNLSTNPYPDPSIATGRYSLLKDEAESHFYRLGHPLAEQVLQTASSKPLPPVSIQFDLSGYHTSVAALSPLLHKEGWLALHRLKISSLDEQEFLCFTGCTTDGEILSENQCQRLFNLSGEITTTDLPTQAQVRLTDLWQSKRSEIFDTISSENVRYFDEEMEKLDAWADDKAKSLKFNLKELEDEIKRLKKSARQSANLPEKLELQKKIRHLEDKHQIAWKSYEDAKREINRNKDSLLDEISARLEQQEEVEKLFVIQWKVT